MIREFQYITSNPKILEGRPIIKNTRISVSLILEWLANDSSIDDIVEEFPQLKKEAVKEAIQYAAVLSNGSIIEFELPLRDVA